MNTNRMNEIHRLSDALWAWRNILRNRQPRLHLPQYKLFERHQKIIEQMAWDTFI